MLFPDKWCSARRPFPDVIILNYVLLIEIPLSPGYGKDSIYYLLICMFIIEIQLQFLKEQSI